MSLIEAGPKETIKRDYGQELVSWSERALIFPSWRTVSGCHYHDPELASAGDGGAGGGGGGGRERARRLDFQAKRAVGGHKERRATAEKEPESPRGICRSGTDAEQ